MTQRSTRQIWLRLSAGACLGVASIASGCGGSTPEQDAIAEASARLYGLGVAGGSPLPGTAERQKAFTSVLQSVSKAASSSNPGEVAAANALMARANVGLAELAAFRAADIERSAIAEVARIRAVFDQWLSQQSVADSLRAYDPTAELAKLDGEIRTREAEAEEARKAKAAQVALVEQIRQKAEQARQQAAGLRDQEAQIRSSVAGASQTQRAAALEQAQTIKRQGDEFEKQAGVFDAEAAAQAPEITTLDSTIQKLERQVALLRESKQAMITRSEASRAQADSATAEASEGAKQVTQLLGTLDEVRASLEAPHEESMKYFNAAVAAAKKSGAPGDRATSSLTVGNVQQSMADALATRARGLGVYASLLANLNQGGQPGVGPERVQAAEQAHAAAVTAAREAYQAAAQSYEGGGGSGEARERLEKIAKAVADLAKEAEAKPAEPAPAGGQPAADAGGEGNDAAVEATFDADAVTAEVRDALKTMKAAFNENPTDPAVSSRWIEANDPQVKAFVDAGLALSANKKALDEACVAKFGKNLGTLVQESTSQSVKSSPMLGMLDTMSADMAKQLETLDPDTVEVTPERADRAMVSLPGTPMPSVMTKTAEGWKLSLDAMFGQGPGKGMLAMIKGPVEAMGGVFASMADKVSKGEYADAEAMLLGLNGELMAAMQKAMPGGAAPGGGGGG